MELIQNTNLCRMHAQALTLAVLSGAAMLHYYNNPNYADADIGDNNKNDVTGAHSSSFDEEERLSWWF